MNGNDIKQKKESITIQGIPLTNEGTGVCKCERGCKYSITHDSFQMT